MNAVITGASRGIGKAIARVYALHGYNLYLSSRNEHHLLQAMEELRTAYPHVSVNGAAFFAPIVGNGTYELTMTLQDTVGPDGGFIDFQDGGSFALDGGVRVTNVPEPITLSLLGGGLFGAIVMRRHKKRVR